MTGPKTVVVVDDDKAMNTALKRLLLAAGFQVKTFPSAEALIGSASAGASDCLILDINLPGMSGLELARHLRVTNVSQPIIFITAYDNPTYQEQARAAGGLTCITKPFSSRELLTAIQTALQSRVVGFSR